MHFIAFTTLILALLLCLAAGSAVAASPFLGRMRITPWLERSHLLATFLVTFGCAILLGALTNHDYSFEYVRNYTSNTLPMFYKVTAFWAGQAGSLLFWGWVTMLCGAAFVFTRAYRDLSDETKRFFWLFHMAVTAFFLFLLTTWSNPYVRVVPPPADGHGLNPLLQNVGMIFHPPLLFLGYAGFTVPACLALAQSMSRGRDTSSWVETTRNFSLIGWLALTAGILLGGWWSYMELGWGGYWAWDPVENASLIPWFAGTAFLHTSVAQRRRGSLKRFNVLMVSLTMIMSFFATYLVRSGVVDSLHAFGDGGVGTPLLIFILFLTALTLFIAHYAFPGQSRELGSVASREGFLFITSWVLLILGAVILLGTMWPVITNAFGGVPKGLEAGFYNTVSLPFFVLLSLMVATCPWLGWKSGLTSRRNFLVLAGLFVGLTVLLAVLGNTNPVSLLGASSALASIAGILFLLATDKAVRKVRVTWAAYGVHLGLGLVILGVAYSGPYQVEYEETLDPGQSFSFRDYTVTFEGLNDESTPAMAFVEAVLEVEKNGKPYGRLTPQLRNYAKSNQTFSEVSVIPSLGDELYATLMAVDGRRATVEVSIHPLINWMWIGGTLMCLFPLLGLGLGRRKPSDANIREHDA